MCAFSASLTAIGIDRSFLHRTCCCGLMNLQGKTVLEKFCCGAMKFRGTCNKMSAYLDSFTLNILTT
ncbi:MAG: hypothetical protein D3910_06160 [Candidatus Electrothrix sp. ATG2]|nr:hypothetical protein [Candidatus Electrothrix sp. ATG2]